MKRKNIIIILILGIVLLTGCSETKEENEIVSDNFKFLLDMSNISNDWWNSVNDDWEELGYTNKDIYDKRWEQVLGNTDGKLQVHPIGFTENIKIGYKLGTIKDDYYSLTIADNNFLIPQEIHIINDKINNTSSMLVFYVLGNDLWFYRVVLEVDNNPSDIELSKESWKTVSVDKDSYIDMDSYYPINSDYCLHISYPVLKEGDNTKIEESDLKELADAMTSIISLNEIDKVDGELSFTVQQDNIQLDENTTLLLKDMKIYSWNSGAEGLVHSLTSDNNIVAYNSSGSWTYFNEYNKAIDLDSYLSFYNLGIKEYNYKGKDIYITYFTDEISLDAYKGNYNSIMFKIDDIWYSIHLSTPIDPQKADVDAWIKTMCDGIIYFA